MKKRRAIIGISPFQGYVDSFEPIPRARALGYRIVPPRGCPATLDLSGDRMGVMDPLFERFGNDARDVMIQAECEASRLNHEYLGTEHILLGLTKSSGGAIEILKNLELCLVDIRRTVEKVIRSGPLSADTNLLPFTPRSRRAVDNAIDEARKAHRRTVGSEHILLGLIRDPESVAYQVLLSLGVDVEEVRTQARILDSDRRT
jgi:ATP-dependent Clp protease ATP-binding subunit ClpC